MPPPNTPDLPDEYMRQLAEERATSAGDFLAMLATVPLPPHADRAEFNIRFIYDDNSVMDMKGSLNPPPIDLTGAPPQSRIHEWLVKFGVIKNA